MAPVAWGGEGKGAYLLNGLRREKSLVSSHLYGKTVCGTFVIAYILMCAFVRIDIPLYVCREAEEIRAEHQESLLRHCNVGNVGNIGNCPATHQRLTCNDGCLAHELKQGLCSGGGMGRRYEDNAEQHGN